MASRTDRSTIHPLLWLPGIVLVMPIVIGGLVLVGSGVQMIVLWGLDSPGLNGTAHLEVGLLALTGGAFLTSPAALVVFWIYSEMMSARSSKSYPVDKEDESEGMGIPAPPFGSER